MPLRPPHFVPRLGGFASRTTITTKPTTSRLFHPISVITHQYVRPIQIPSLVYAARPFSEGSYRPSIAPIMTTSLTLSPTDTLLKLITTSFHGLPPATVSDSAQISSIKLRTEEIVSGTNTITTHLSPQLFPDVEYSDIENAEIGQWLTISALNQDAPTKQYLETLNVHLKTRTTILGDKPSVADLAVYVRIKEHVSKWDVEKRTGGETGGWRYIVRWVDFVQNAVEVFGIKVPEEEKVKIDVSQVKTQLKTEEPAKEKKGDGAAAATGAEEGKKGKKEKKGGKVEDKTEKVVEEVKEKAKDVKEKVKDAAAGGGGGGAASEAGKKDKKAKKEKAPKAPAPKKEEPILSPALVDLRVGQILKCVPHPNADSLYMSTVSCGDTPESTYINPYPDPTSPDTPPTRTVLSGLRGKIPIEEMQLRKVVLVCNLKPANMRGIKSSAMVLAASPRLAPGEDPHAGVVELVEPPADAKVGERVFFEGYNYTPGTPELQLNPKQKVMEFIQPGFYTTEELEVAFDGDVVFVGKEGDLADGKWNKGKGRLVTESGGVCKVKSLKGALVR